MEDINVGEKILEYRKAKNLSIRSLSDLSGVTSSMLSQIERGLANPSINTLKTIAKALDVPIFNFFMSSVDSETLVVRADQRKKMIFPDNNNFAYELLSPNTSGAIGLMLMTLTPNTTTSEELMGHTGEEAAYISEGKINLHFEDQMIVLNTGDSIRILPHMKHKWTNPYKEDSKVIFAVSPPSF